MQEMGIFWPESAPSTESSSISGSAEVGSDLGLTPPCDMMPCTRSIRESSENCFPVIRMPLILRRIAEIA